MSVDKRFQTTVHVQEVLWYFPFPISLGPGSPALWFYWKVAVSVCRSLWSAVTQWIPRERVTRGGEERQLKCSARYSKRCLINNVSERTSWDTAGPLFLSQALTHAPAHTNAFEKGPINPNLPLRSAPPKSSPDIRKKMPASKYMCHYIDEDSSVLLKALGFTHVNLKVITKTQELLPYE